MIQWLRSLYPRQISSFGFGFFGWALPRSLSLRCFALWRNANLAGGFAGRFWLRFLFCLICLSWWFARVFGPHVSYTLLLFTAYAIVRTVPSAIGQIGGKKWTAALCDLGDPGWGDPWFLHWALLLLTPSDLAPGVFVVVLCFLLVRDHYHHDTQDVIMHESPLLVAIPLLGVLLVVLFLLGLLFFVVAGFLFVFFVGFACLFLWFVLCFWFSCWDCILDCVQVHYQYFCGYRQLTALHDNLNSSFATIERV